MPSEEVFDQIFMPTDEVVASVMISEEFVDETHESWPYCDVFNPPIHLVSYTIRDIDLSMKRQGYQIDQLQKELNEYKEKDSKAEIALPPD